MVSQGSLLILSASLVDQIPMSVEPTQRKRGRTKTYPNKLFLKALVIMIVRQVQTPFGLLALLEEPSTEMQALRQQLTLPDGKRIGEHGNVACQTF